ncbi:hypothetical protein HDV04_001621 [Boothiomyces sp. JEL0838]|nr:hypothetical protein HDV04_001621 [Boothiomyces sp. JEL0838]
MNNLITKPTSNNPYYGIIWYKTRGKKSGINEYLQDQQDFENGGLMIKRWHPIHGQFWGVGTKQQLERLITKNTYTYEILHPDRKRKVYFDIDYKTTDEENVLDKIKKVILHQFPKARMNISGYVNADKTSYHIILENYHFDNQEEAKQFLNPFTSAHSSLGFDNAVYNRFSVFKCINQSKPKPDAPIQAYIEGNENVGFHLVQTNFVEDSINASTLKWENYNIQKRQVPVKSQIKDIINFNPGDMFLKDIPDDFTLANSSAIEKLRILPNPPRGIADGYLRHNEIWKIMIWARNEEINFDDFWEWNKTKDASESRMVKYNGYWNENLTYKISEEFINALLIKAYPELLNDICRRRFEKLNNVQNTKTVDKTFVSHDDISDVKYTFLNVRMGGNKTGSVANYLKKNPFDRILFIVPRISLAYDLLGRFPDFTVYEKVKDKRTLKNFDKLIVSIQSLHYLTDVQYDCIILDEIETTLNTFSGDVKTHKTRASNNTFVNWKFWLNFMKNAKKVFTMDAFLTNNTIELLRMNEPSAEFEVIGLKGKPEVRYFKKCDIQEWLNKIGESIESGEKIIIFVPYKQRIKGKSIPFGVDELEKYLSKKYNWEIGKDIIGYFAEKEDEKKRLKNVEDVWKQAKCIISNTCISVGVNYLGIDFDRLFCFFAKWVDSNDFVQFLYRVRNLKNNEMLMYCEKGTRVDRYKTETLKTRCEIWKHLQLKFQISDSTSQKQKLSVLSKRANIVTKPHRKNDSSEKVKERLQNTLNLFDIQEFTIKWNEIPEIDEDEFVKLTDNHETDSNDLVDSLKLKKFILRNKFKSEIPDETLMTFFLNDTLDSFDELIDCKKNVINQIFEYNNTNAFDALLMNNSLDFKIPPYMTNDFLKKHFHFHHPVTKRGKYLLYRIFKAYFKREVYSIERDDQNNRTYSRLIDFWYLIDSYQRYSLKYNSGEGALLKYMFIEDEPDVREMFKHEPEWLVEAIVSGRPFEFDRKTGKITYDDSDEYQE